MTKLHSADIQKMVFDWANTAGFTAPYGVLEGEHVNKRNGKKYKSVTFGYARTLDATVEIYNSGFMLYRSSQNHGQPVVFKSADDLMAYLKGEFSR